MPPQEAARVIYDVHTAPGGPKGFRTAAPSMIDG
jgi:hypothetical protein